MHFRCGIDYCWTCVGRFGLGFYPWCIYFFCTSHVYAYFMHMYLFFPFLVCVVLSFSLFLSRIDCAMAPRAHKSTPSRNPLQGSGFSSFDPLPHLHVRFRDEKARKGLLGELLETWRSSGEPGYFVESCRHSTTRCHSNSGMGIFMWETRAVSHHVYAGVLLQYTRHRYLCTSVCHYILRYTHRSYPESYIRGTTRFKGSAF